MTFLIFFFAQHQLRSLLDIVIQFYLPQSILKQGYFQILFSCIEKLLAFLNVKSLVLPAAYEAESIWTNKFGFEKIPPDQVCMSSQLISCLFFLEPFLT